MRMMGYTWVCKVDKWIGKHEKISVIVMMIAVSAILCHPFFDVYPMHTTTDELGAIVGAASLAGYDWSGVIDRSGYYGFGYYSLFAPLFMLHLSPVLIYRVILIVTRIIKGSVISGTAYYIGRHYYKMSSGMSLILLSLICAIPLHTNNYANIINDVIIDVFLWIIILAVCKIAEHSGKRAKCIKWISIYVAVSFWASFIHTRAVVMIIASFLVLLGILVVYKKKSLFVSFMVIPTAVLSQMFIAGYQNGIWSVSGERLGNASISVATEFSIVNLNTWEIWIDMLIGHMGVQTLLTGGLFWAAIIAVVKYGRRLITHKVTQQTEYINIVLTISILSMGAVFVAFLVSKWFMGMYDTWDTVEKGQAYAYKAMCYVRYWNVFAMPFLFTGISFLGKREYEDCVKNAVVSGILLMFGFVTFVIPIVQDNASAGGFLYVYLTERFEAVTAQFYYKCILICAIFATASVLAFYSRHGKRWAVLPIVALMILGYCCANKYYNKPVTESVSAMVLSSYEQKCVLEESGVVIGNVYAYDDRTVNDNWYIYSVLQFYFYEYRIEDEYPEKIEENDIIITCGRSGKIEEDFPQLKCYQLDDNEVWYTSMELIGYEPLER